MESSRLQGYANPHAKKFQFHLKQDSGSRRGIKADSILKNLSEIKRSRAFFKVP